MRRLERKMNARNSRASMLTLGIGFFTLALRCQAQLTGTIEAKQVMFVNGKPSVAEGSGTVKNERGETVAAGALSVNNGTMGLLGKKGASFTLAISPTTPPPTDWPSTAPANAARVDFDGKDRWTLKDDQFLFILEVGGGFRGSVSGDRSLLSSSNITFPEGTYTMWQHSITVGQGGGSVVFKQGHPVDGDNATVETPDKKKLEFPRSDIAASRPEKEVHCRWRFAACCVRDSCRLSLHHGREMFRQRGHKRERRTDGIHDGEGAVRLYPWAKRFLDHVPLVSKAGSILAMVLVGT
jgi:hypothetical protein